MDSKLVSYYTGITIVVASHLYTLSKSKMVSGDMMTIHSIVNLVAAALIAYYFVNKEQLFK